MAETVHNPETRFERSDVPLKLVAYLGAGLAAALLLFPLLVLVLLPGSVRDTPTAPSALPPAPPLQTQPETDLAIHRAAEEEHLSSWGWVDRARGVVHMPIEEAMRRTAAAGIPDWPAGASGGGPAAGAR
jgi:hypothetical protein